MERSFVTYEVPDSDQGTMDRTPLSTPSPKVLSLWELVASPVT